MRQYAVMVAPLLETDDDDILPSKRRCWVKGLMLNKELGTQNQLYKELLENDTAEYRHLSVPHEVFIELLARVRPRIRKQETNMRRPGRF